MTHLKDEHLCLFRPPQHARTHTHSLIKWGWDLNRVTYIDKQVHEQVGEVNQLNGLERERPRWTGSRVIQALPQNGCLLRWPRRTIKTPINRMGFQASNILFSFSTSCSFLLTQVRHAWGSNGSIHEAPDGGWL